MTEQKMLLCLQWRACSTKVIKMNVKPVIDTFMLAIVFGADLLAREAFLECLRLRRCAVLVRAA